MSKQQSAVSVEETTAMFDLNLKNRALAGLLAWLVPGLGHLYQGRTAKGLLFMICLVSTFAFGCYVGGGRVVYASTKPVSGPLMQIVFDHWHFPFQAGIGTVAVPAVIERQRMMGGKESLFGVLTPPHSRPDEHVDDNGQTVSHPDQLARWRYEGGFFSELGTIYTVIAGMLNILVIYDACSGPLIIRRVEPEDEPSSSDKPPT